MVKRYKETAKNQTLLELENSKVSKCIRTEEIPSISICWKNHYRNRKGWSSFIKKWKCKWNYSVNRVWLFMTPWTIAYHTLLSMGFSRQEYWSGLPFPEVTKPHFYRSFLLLVPEKLKQWWKKINKLWMLNPSDLP